MSPHSLLHGLFFFRLLMNLMNISMALSLAFRSKEDKKIEKFHVSSICSIGQSPSYLKNAYPFAFQSLGTFRSPWNTATNNAIYIQKWFGARQGPKQIRLGCGRSSRRTLARVLPVSAARGRAVSWRCVKFNGVVKKLIHSNKIVFIQHSEKQHKKGGTQSRRQTQGIR